jgi:hypothetical protein
LTTGGDGAGERVVRKPLGGDYAQRESSTLSRRSDGGSEGIGVGDRIIRGMRRRSGQKKLIALDIGTLTNEELVFRAGVLGESVVGLDDGAGWVAGIQVPAGVARRWWQDAGKVSDMATVGMRHTYNIATRNQGRVSRLLGWRVEWMQRWAKVGWIKALSQGLRQRALTRDINVEDDTGH